MTKEMRLSHCIDVLAHDLVYYTNQNLVSMVHYAIGIANLLEDLIKCSL